MRGDRNVRGKLFSVLGSATSFWYTKSSCFMSSLSLLFAVVFVSYFVWRFTSTDTVKRKQIIGILLFRLDKQIELEKYFHFSLVTDNLSLHYNERINIYHKYQHNSCLNKVDNVSFSSKLNITNQGDKDNKAIILIRVTSPEGGEKDFLQCRYQTS